MTRSTVCLLLFAVTTQLPPEAGRIQRLTGVWKFDPSQTKDDQRNWRRPVAPGPSAPIYVPSKVEVGSSQPLEKTTVTTPVTVRSSGGGVSKMTPSRESPANEIARALRDLLELALTYEIRVGDGVVVFTDDLGRTMTFATSGKNERQRVAATEFTSTTSWNDGRLVQQFDSVHRLRLTQTYLPGADGKTLLVHVTIDRPALTPEIEPFTRVYVRVQ